MHHYTDGGLRNVWLANGYEIRKTPHGKAIAIRDLDGLTQALCETFVRQGKPLSGTEFRYVRTSGLQLSQPALGGSLGTDARTVARWEKQGRIPKMADKMIRLIYLEHVNGNERLRSAFETLRAMERAKNGPHPTRVIAEAKGEHWESRLEGDDEVNAAEQPS